jgi:hypothetical protein
MQDGGWCVGVSWRATMGDHEALWWCGVREKRELEWAPTVLCLFITLYIYIYMKPPSCSNLSFKR